MVFYETFCLFGKQMTRGDIRGLVAEKARIITKHNGVLLKVQDLGWRKLSRRVKSPKSGVHWSARCFSLSFAARPTAVVELNGLLNTCGGVLRHQTAKMKRQSAFLLYNGGATRASEPNSEAYQHNLQNL
eukprot:GHVT01058741.1.p1 GENE.GHVT01058741.1~~GHVT01058741.1.p1  ORF type:complete len:130 (+),score=16.90 GHVT01058741.1:1366-1755(+)